MLRVLLPFLTLLSSCNCQPVTGACPTAFSCQLKARKPTVTLGTDAALSLTISTQCAESISYKLHSWQVLEEQQGMLTHHEDAPLLRGTTALVYTPQTPGKHVVRVAVEGAGTQRMAQCTLQAEEATVAWHPLLAAQDTQITLRAQGKLVLAPGAACTVKRWHVHPLAAPDKVGKLYTAATPSALLDEGHKCSAEHMELYLFPQHTGTHEACITLVNEAGEEKEVKTQVSVKAEPLPYTIRLTHEGQNCVVIDIESEDEALKKGPWRIKSLRWNQMVGSTVVSKAEQGPMCYGKNKIRYTLNEQIDRPAISPILLTLEIEGPDGQVTTHSLFKPF